MAKELPKRLMITAELLRGKGLGSAYIACKEAAATLRKLSGEEQLKALGAALDIANEQREAADRAKIEHWELRKQAERDAAKWKERCNNRTPEDVEAALKAYDGLAIAQQKEITYLRSERDKFKKACSDLAPYVPAAD